MKSTLATALALATPVPRSAPQSVAATARAMTTAMTTDAIAAGPAWVWKTSRDGASFVWVSMIANRIRTLIAPM